MMSRERLVVCVRCQRERLHHARGLCTTCYATLRRNPNAPLGASRLIDITGQRFGRLVVIESAGNNKHGQAMWRARCDCGTLRVVLGNSLRSGRSQSCGCLWRELIAIRSTTHGMSGTPEFGTWGRMIQRCYNSRLPQFGDWGGRGIRVCDEWRHSFEAFYAHIGPRPGREYSLDRIDNDSSYSPGNVRWATRSEQNANKRAGRIKHGRRLTWNGETLSVNEWAARLGLNPRTIRERIYQTLPIEQILAPTNQRRRQVAA